MVPNETRKPEASFSLSILQNKLKRNQVTALHLMVGFLLIVMGFVTWLVPGSLKRIEYAFLDTISLIYIAFGCFLLLVSVFFNKKIIQGKSNLFIRFLEVLALLPILIYSLMQKWYLPAAYSTAAFIGIAFAYLWEKSAGRKVQVVVTDTGVHLPYFSGKTLKWPEIERFIIKHGVLTVDCRDNHLYQYEIQATDPRIIASILTFAEQNIARSKHLYDTDW
jgi:hypothetical protein